MHFDIQISLYPSLSLFRAQQQLIQLPIKSSSLPLWKNHVSQGLLLCNVLILFFLGIFWFGTHLYFSLNPYMHFKYLWSTSIAKTLRHPKYVFHIWSISIGKYRCYQKYFLLSVVCFYSKRPELCRGQ